MTKVIPTLWVLFSWVGAFSQVSEINAAVALGNSQGSVSLSFGRDWELGKSKKFAVGVGGRFTSYVGSNQHYITAPAELTSGSTGPFVIFKENIEENIDTFLVSSPQVNSLNAFINLRFAVNNKFHVGFTIDLIGVSFGSKENGTFIHNGEEKREEAKPTAFNILLISDNDRGSLNSELYGKYFWNQKWASKLGVQFLFTEYTTESNVQEYPELNDRFRNKSLMLALGIAYRL